MNSTRPFLAAAILFTLAASVSLDQVRQVQMGGGMDVNPQVGTGGSNRPVPGFVPINGNDIMTGNVSGLSYFHGRVGSSSPYQFQGSLGSSTLNNFARQSAGGPYGMTQTYYLPSAVVSSSQGAMYSSPTGGGFDSSLIPRSSISPVANSSQLNAGPQYQVINLAVPALRISPGDPGAVLTNSLFVLRTTELPTRRPDIGQPTTLPGTMPAPGVDTGAAPPPNPDMVQGAVNAGHDERINGQSPDIKLARVSENYLKLAEELRQNGAPAAGTENKGPDTGLAPKSANALADYQLDPFTGKPRQLATLAPGPVGLGASSAGARKPELAPSARRLADMTDAELLAGSRIKPVKLSGQGGGAAASGYEMMMLRAEKNLKEAKFLDAAESYQTALTIKPEDPLALVGRAHAEMSAGVYTAAEFDLKFVYTRKPELVAVKYEVDSFIPASRQACLLQDLQELTAQKDTADMASFLYCYLCYETGRGPELQAELKKWGARNAHDEWQTVAARAWMAK